MVIPSPTPTAIAAASDSLSPDTVLGAIVAIVTLIGVAASIWLGIRAQNQARVLAKDEADRAERAQMAGEASAERAERAAALTIDSLSRMADSLDRIADSGLGGTTLLAAAPPERVAWSLTHFQGDTYLLENVGTGTARQVVVSADETLLQPGEWPTEDVMRPRDSIQFMAVMMMNTRDRTITVEWLDDQGESDTWRYPLPPRPPR